MEPILEMRNISKSFPGVKALDKVNLKVMPGEIHALVGENGAGKSTMMKVLSGVYPFGSYEGDILYQGKVKKFSSIKDSEDEGIIIIHQELALVPMLSIAENIFLGNEQVENGVINWPKSIARANEVLRKVGLKESSTALVDSLGIGKQQLVEIAKALSKQVKLLILDEPTASLQENDSKKLLDLMLELKKQGVTCIMISHKLNEIREVADNITVIRDGSTISTLSCANGEISEGKIIKDMVGRDLKNRFPDKQHNPGDVLMEVSDWNVYHPQHSSRHLIKNIQFHLRKGEVLGIAGLMGSGRTELAMSLFGRSYGQNISGTVKMDGKTIDVSSVQKAIQNGLAYVTEDRKDLGLILDENIVKNITLTNLPEVAANGVLSDARERQVAEGYKDKMNIRCPSVLQHVVNLSGGNQQKVVLSKWLFAEPQVLILDEPTRGIDVGAKFEIYTLINEIAGQDKGVIIISSEMPEILGMCDRIYVMNEGEFVSEIMAEDASQEKIMSAIVEHNNRKHQQQRERELVNE